MQFYLKNSILTSSMGFNFEHIFFLLSWVLICIKKLLEPDPPKFKADPQPWSP